MLVVEEMCMLVVTLEEETTLETTIFLDTKEEDLLLWVTDTHTALTTVRTFPNIQISTLPPITQEITGNP